MFKTSILLSIFLINFGVCASASAQSEAPTHGMLYNTKEASLLTYDCKKLNDGKLDCEFIQTSVRKKAKPEDLKKQLDDAKKQFPDALKEVSSEDVCVANQPIMEVLQGKRTAEEVAEIDPQITNKAEFIQGVKDMPETDKAEVLKTFAALQNFCKEKSEESFLELTKLSHDKDSRTCTISAGYGFSQTFIYVEDFESTSTGAWVVESKPDGPCGVVQLSRFIPEKSEVKGSDLIWWKYIAKKAVTNTEGTLLLDMKCNQLDEGEYLYDWKTSAKTDRLYHMGCEYIEFSPV